MPSSIIYNGPSLLDGQPIVVIAQTKTRNRKTGDMVQTYILRADIDPITANRTGGDFSICGNCPLRGKAHDGDKGTAKERGCYVTLAHGPRSVYAAYKRGVYDEVSGHEAIKAIGKGRMVRIGTYGDGAAVPSYIWDSLCDDAAGWTAYTHQNSLDGAATDPKRFMTSAETEGQAQAAWAMGQRTFRMIADVADMVKGKEILCPASEEAGKRTTCDTCGLCAGASIKAKSIAIVAHGGSARTAKALLAA